MGNVFFMKDPIANTENGVSFVELNQKQVKEALVFAINTLLIQQKKIILILFSQNAKIIAETFNKQRNKLHIIDCFSKPTNQQENYFHISNPSSLTDIQVNLDLIEKKISGKKIIIIDSLNTMAVYNKKDAIGRFMHLLINKIRLKENAGFIFTEKESTEEDILSIMHELCDKTYCFAELFDTNIER